MKDMPPKERYKRGKYTPAAKVKKNSESYIPQ
jgi:hypothetical protein